MMSAVAWGLMAPALMIPVSESNERHIFHIPGVEDVRTQLVSRVGNETGWPFTVEEGYLTCSFAAGQPIVFFVVLDDDNASAVPVARVVSVTTDPFEATFGNIAVNDLIVETEGPAERIALFAPFLALGKRLCDQPRGTDLRPGEL